MRSKDPRSCRTAAHPQLNPPINRPSSTEPPQSVTRSPRVEPADPAGPESNTSKPHLKRAAKHQNSNCCRNAPKCPPPKCSLPNISRVLCFHSIFPVVSEFAITRTFKSTVPSNRPNWHNNAGSHGEPADSAGPVLRAPRREGQHPPLPGRRLYQAGPRGPRAGLSGGLVGAQRQGRFLQVSTVEG